jgi:hypothetical protein
MQNTGNTVMNNKDRTLILMEFSKVRTIDQKEVIIIELIKIMLSTMKEIKRMLL